MKRLVRFLLRPLYHFIMRPQLRYRFIPVWNQFASYNGKEQILLDAFGFVDFTKVRGDYFEFGIWKGEAIIAAHHLSKRFKELKEMRFFGFDSFEGLPQVGGIDAHSSEFKKGSYAAGLQEVQSHLKKSGVDLSRVTLVPGWFQESLNEETRAKYSVNKAAVIYIDSDLYSSAVSVLKFITPSIQDGTVIIFDDWYCFHGHPDHGEQKAFAEWLKKNPQFNAVPYHDFGWAGKTFIINTPTYQDQSTS